jgi:hypothetical protein
VGLLEWPGCLSHAAATHRLELPLHQLGEEQFQGQNQAWTVARKPHTTSAVKAPVNSVSCCHSPTPLLLGACACLVVRDGEYLLGPAAKCPAAMPLEEKAASPPSSLGGYVCMPENCHIAHPCSTPRHASWTTKISAPDATLHGNAFRYTPPGTDEVQVPGGVRTVRAQVGLCRTTQHKLPSGPGRLPASQAAEPACSGHGASLGWVSARRTEPAPMLPLWCSSYVAVPAAPLPNTRFRAV